MITDENVGNIRAKAILELANGPITSTADEVLFKKGIPVVPDILANSGGVVVSYFEWDQNLKNEKWSEAEVHAKLQSMMAESARMTLDKSKEANTDFRMGAFIAALQRISENL